MVQSVCNVAVFIIVFTYCSNGQKCWNVKNHITSTSSALISWMLYCGTVRFNNTCLAPHRFLLVSTFFSPFSFVLSNISNRLLLSQISPKTKSRVRFARVSSALASALSHTHSLSKRRPSLSRDSITPHSLSRNDFSLSQNDLSLSLSLSLFFFFFFFFFLFSSLLNDFSYSSSFSITGLTVSTNQTLSFDIFALFFRKELPVINPKWPRWATRLLRLYDKTW